MPQAAELRFKTYNTYRKAEHMGSKFTYAEKAFDKWDGRRKNYTADLGNKTSRFWNVLSPFVVIAAVCLGYYQAYSVKDVVQAVIDPEAKGYNPEIVYLSVGAGISIIGMVIGHLLHEGVKRNELTGGFRFQPIFWTGLILTIFYLGFQFLFSKAGNSETTQKTDYMSYAVVCFGVFEIILGALLLEKSFTYIALFFNAFFLGYWLRGMRKTSRKTNDLYRDYLGFLTIHNQQAGIELIEREGNDNIRRAIAYYSNIRLEDGNKALPTEQPAVPLQSRDNSSDSSPHTPVEPARHVTISEAENHLDDFIRDSTNEDLTA